MAIAGNVAGYTPMPHRGSTSPFPSSSVLIKIWRRRGIDICVALLLHLKNISLRQEANFELLQICNSYCIIANESAFVLDIH